MSAAVEHQPNLRKSGKTPAQEIAHEEVSETSLYEVPDHEPELVSSFQHLSMSWSGQDKQAIDACHTEVAERISAEFADALEILSFVGDVSKLSYRQREDVLYSIALGMPTWEEHAQHAWFEAQMAKAVWEESFATGFESLPYDERPRPTVDDRTQRARRHAATDRSFALVLTYYARRAEGMLRSLRDLSQRIKDIHVA
jgi:hypothetical protein